MSQAFNLFFFFRLFSIIVVFRFCQKEQRSQLWMQAPWKQQMGGEYGWLAQLQEQHVAHNCANAKCWERFCFSVAAMLCYMQHKNTEKKAVWCPERCLLATFFSIPTLLMVHFYVYVLAILKFILRRQQEPCGWLHQNALNTRQYLTTERFIIAWVLRSKK